MRFVVLIVMPDSILDFVHPGLDDSSLPLMLYDAPVSTIHTVES